MKGYAIKTYGGRSQDISSLNIPYCIDLTWNPLNIYITKYKIKQFLKIKSKMKQVNLTVCPSGA